MSAVNTESVVNTECNVQWFEHVKPKFTTKKFAELKPGIYDVTPLRRINTKYGHQLICDINGTEYYVPNSMTNDMITKLEGVEHKCKLNLFSVDTSKKTPKYNFLIGRLDDNPVVPIERPIQESAW